MEPAQTVMEALAEIRQAVEERQRLVGVRNRAIISARQGGASLREIAEASRLSKDTVAKIVRS